VKGFQGAITRRALRRTPSSTGVVQNRFAVGEDLGHRIGGDPQPIGLEYSISFMPM
jgi:hypothetical protein